MELIVQQGDLVQTPCDVLIVNLFEGVMLPGGATGAVDQALGGWISLRIAQEKFSGKARTILEVPTFGKIPARIVLVAGLGKAEEFTLEGVRQAAGTAIKHAKSLKAETVVTLLHGAGIAGLPVQGCAQAVAEGSLLGDYAFEKYKTPPEEGAAAIKRLLIVERDAEKLAPVKEGTRAGRIIAEAVNMARDLINEPPDLVTPEFLGQSAQVLASEYGIFCEIWDEARIADERMNCLLMVGRGAVNTPRFIRMDYSPSGGAKQRICLGRQRPVLRQRRAVAETGGLYSPHEKRYVRRCGGAGGDAHHQPTATVGGGHRTHSGVRKHDRRGRV